ncbi:Coenzyme F420-dependent N5,N10-methylene tetrahydromethanopterin reductase-related flavin-dependent oxidoreductase [Archaeoglobus sulfaticallidus PM70-1]|uniref:Coenzyme F420-dependent N5,N10-methylene tetrahydromethanopterin reductase-related flavin-dependent oxidoreductase n=1 Tax=Archaeoglobus sulfaticallidus PM70-1 TaxID=387631 RepID=N0BKB3_9EURY|nr:LLM class flavin-dependent oxidoreductase [Archaeoglobus sulfaticallidus]AGK60595.1 Coenzyme F420-dependent N5,N10-methylene tetrahydromethanopterin reductase-related flavin-dependent oxidoreductase [Archaeoglobus sulfaticallidus PM70-1]
MLKIGIQLPHDPHELIIKSAVFADRNGFDSVFTPDHLVGIGIKNWSSYEAFTLLGVLAKLTTKVKLGTCVSDVIRRHPAVLAQFAVTLHDFSSGRAVLGLGAGEGMNLVPYGMDNSYLASKLEEGVRIVRGLMENEKLTFKGRFFEVDNAFIMPRRKVPIWIAGNSPRTMEITAKYADGWIPTAGMGAKRYGEHLRRIRNLAEKFGRRIEAGVFGYVVVDNDYESAVRRIELPAKLLSIMSPARKQFLKEEIDVPDLLSFTFDEDTVKKALEIASKIDFDEVKHRFIFGTPEDVIEKLDEFRKAGAEHFVLTPLVRDREYIPTIKLIAEKVLGYFRES